MHRLVPTQFAVSGVPVMILHQPLRDGTNSYSYLLSPTAGSLKEYLHLISLHRVICLCLGVIIFYLVINVKCISKKNILKIPLDVYRFLAVEYNTITKTHDGSTSLQNKFSQNQEVILLENNRIYNFNPGPAMLPLEVLKAAQAELLNFENTGMSIMEISHRAKAYDKIHNQAKADIKELMGLGDDYEVLFIQGGASMQFNMVPQNFATDGKIGNYILSGSFATKAYKEAAILGEAHIAASSKEVNFKHIPTQEEIKLSDNAAYLHICYNNTIFGTEYHYVPETNGVPLIADMSSDMLSRPVDFSKFSLIYAGVQKNLGPAGVCLVVARKSFIENSPQTLPTMLRYDTYAKNNSLYNTPPAFGIYMVGKVAAWIKEQGGLKAMEKLNAAKAKLVYDAIDNSNGFYRGHADKDSRSFMNVTFRLPSEELEAKFAAEALPLGISGVKGHRSVGGMRTSIYNAMPMEGCQALVDFMEKFRKANS